MNLTMNIIIFVTVMLISSNTFSQVSVEDALKGKVAGLTIFSQSGRAGTPSYIRIRGNGSILGNNFFIFFILLFPYQLISLSMLDLALPPF